LSIDHNNSFLALSGRKEINAAAITSLIPNNSILLLSQRVWIKFTRVKYLFLF
jgi:hypothetical protein